MKNGTTNGNESALETTITEFDGNENNEANEIDEELDVSKLSLI